MPSPSEPKLGALASLMAGCTEQFDTARDELSNALTERLADSDRGVRALALRLAIYAGEVPFLGDEDPPTRTRWSEFGAANTIHYQEMLEEFAFEVDAFALTLYKRQDLNVGDLIDRFGPRPDILFRYVPMVATSNGPRGAHSFVHGSTTVDLLVAPSFGRTNISWHQQQLSELQRRFAELGEPPWLDRIKAARTQFDRDLLRASVCNDRYFGPAETAILGVLLCMCAELAPSEDLARPTERVAHLADFAPYLRSRNHKNIELPALPVPEHYQRLFTRWASRKIHFVKSTNA